MSALRALRTSTFASRCFSTSAARSYNVARMNLLGRVAQDTEIVTSASGTEIGKYSIAINNRNKDGSEHTSFFRVSAFDPTEHTRNLKKGTQVYVEADAQMKKYENKEGSSMTALDLIQRRLTVIRRPSHSEEGVEDA